jgi:hypothetical protein
MTGPGGAGRRRHWRGGAAAGTALAGLLLLTLGPAGIALTAQGYSHQRMQATTAAHHPGTAVRDGPVSFVVYQVHCGRARKSSRFGQLCEVTVSAHNDGTEEVAIPGGAQKLGGSEGAWHHPVADQELPFGVLPPGVAGTATIRFDLPPHSRATRVEVHTSAYSRGQRVLIVGGPLPLRGRDD